MIVHNKLCFITYPFNFLHYFQLKNNCASNVGNPSVNLKVQSIVDRFLQPLIIRKERHDDRMTQKYKSAAKHVVFRRRKCKLYLDGAIRTGLQVVDPIHKYVYDIYTRATSRRVTFVVDWETRVSGTSHTFQLADYDARRSALFIATRRYYSWHGRSSELFINVTWPGAKRCSLNWYRPSQLSSHLTFAFCALHYQQTFRLQTRSHWKNHSSSFTSLIFFRKRVRGKENIL